MDDRDLAAGAAWLKRFQNIDMESAGLVNAAESAAKVSAVVDAAGADMPFEAEPAAFRRRFARLARRD